MVCAREHFNPHVSAPRKRKALILLCYLASFRHFHSAASVRNGFVLPNFRWNRRRFGAFSEPHYHCSRCSQWVRFCIFASTRCAPSAEAESRAEVPLRPITIHARRHRMNRAGAPPPNIEEEQKTVGAGKVLWYVRLFGFVFTNFNCHCLPGDRVSQPAVNRF